MAVNDELSVLRRAIPASIEVDQSQLQLGSQVRSIYNMVLIAVMDAQMKSTNKNGKEQDALRGKWKRSRKTNGVA